MKLLILLFTALLSAQKTTSNTLKVSAGAVHCAFTTFTPAALTGVHIDCSSGTSSFQQDTASAAGQSGKFSTGPDLLEWRLQVSGSAILYQITANGKKETGSL